MAEAIKDGSYSAAITSGGLAIDFPAGIFPAPYMWSSIQYRQGRVPKLLNAYCITCRDPA